MNDDEKPLIEDMSERELLAEILTAMRQVENTVKTLQTVLAKPGGMMALISGKLTL